MYFKWSWLYIYKCTLTQHTVVCKMKGDYIVNASLNWNGTTLDIHASSSKWKWTIYRHNLQKWKVTTFIHVPTNTYYILLTYIISKVQRATIVHPSTSFWNGIHDDNDRHLNTNLVENIQYLLPVKFRWIPFSGCREEVENVSANQRLERPSC